MITLLGLALIYWGLHVVNSPWEGGRLVTFPIGVLLILAGLYIFGASFTLQSAGQAYG